MSMFEIRGAPPDIPAEKRVPWEDIISLYETVYDYHCSLGVIRLKHIGALDHDATEIRIQARLPKYRKAAEEVAALQKTLEGGGSLDADQMVKFDELIKIMALHAHEFTVSCFIEPKIKKPEELSYLFFELKPEEREELYKMLSVLANPSVGGKVSATIATLSQMFHVPLAKEMTMENMPAKVADALTQVVAERVKTAQEMQQ